MDKKGCSASDYTDLSIYKDKGMFKYVSDDCGDCSRRMPLEVACEAFQKLPNPPPIIISCAIAEKMGGTDKGRMWISYKGNFQGGYAIPEKMITNRLHIETFPILGSFAVRDVFNHYSPGVWYSKFPNDVVCKEHTGKASGICFRREYGYLICGFGANLVRAPPNEMIRKQGLMACCLKNHTDNIPDRLDFVYEIAMRTLELCKEYDTIEKIVKFNNDGFSEYGPKQWRIEINNPNADPDVDGGLWCSSHPNALTKGYLNDVLYDRKWTYFDNFSLHRVAEDEAAFSEIINKVNEERKKDAEKKDA